MDADRIIYCRQCSAVVGHRDGVRIVIDDHDVAYVDPAGGPVRVTCAACSRRLGLTVDAAVSRC